MVYGSFFHTAYCLCILLQKRGPYSVTLSIYTYIYISTYVCTYTDEHVYIRIYVTIYIAMYIYVCMSIYVHITSVTLRFGNQAADPQKKQSSARSPDGPSSPSLLRGRRGQLRDLARSSEGALFGYDLSSYWGQNTILPKQELHRSLRYAGCIIIPNPKDPCASPISGSLHEGSYEFESVFGVSILGNFHAGLLHMLWPSTVVLGPFSSHGLPNHPPLLLPCLPLNQASSGLTRGEPNVEAV